MSSQGPTSDGILPHQTDSNLVNPHPLPLTQSVQKDPIAPLSVSVCFLPTCQHSNRWDSQFCSQCGSPLRLKEQYRATRLMRRGNFSHSYLAIDESQRDRLLVVKQFCTPLESVETKLFEQASTLFNQEAVLLQKLGIHPQIPSLVAFLEADNRRYLVQELIEGQSLFQRYQQDAVFDEGSLESLLQNLLPVLQFIHDRQIIHRDIKPGNIIQSSSGILHLIDFGGAYHVTLGRCGRVGTPGYAAPEQFRGIIYPASDLYSLGMTCLRLLTHQLPHKSDPDAWFDTQSQDWLWQQARVLVRPHLSRILERLIQVDVRSRYQSASEVLQDLSSPELAVLRPSAFLSFAKPSPTSLEVTAIPRQVTPLTEQIAQAPTYPAPPKTTAANPDRYQHLKQLLAQQNYHAADAETWHLLLQLGDLPAHQSLSLSAIACLPRAEIQVLDQLWQVASRGRFGFTVQRQLFQRPDLLHPEFDYSHWLQFAEQVGWFRDGDWLHYTDLSFSNDAPIGHLPASFVSLENRVGSASRENSGASAKWWRLGFVSFMDQLETE